MFFPIFFLDIRSEVLRRMVQQTDKGWLTVLEKNGLCLAADIFENYGIDSETDLSVLDQDDFSKLASRGLKPLHVKKVECWCDAVRERAENMLPSSLNTPASAAVLSSEELNVVTSATHSVAAAESVSENDIERGGEEDDDDSDNDSQIVGEQSCTTDSTGASSAARLTIKFDRLMVLSKSSLLGWFLHVSLIVIIKSIDYFVYKPFTHKSKKPD